MAKTSPLTELKNMSQNTRFYVPPKSIFIGGTAAFAALLVVGLLLVYGLVSSREKALYNDLQNRMEIMTQDKSDLVQSWSKTLKESGAYMTDADAMRQFTFEKDLVLKGHKKGLSTQSEKHERGFQLLLDEYVRQNKLASAYIAGENGEIFMQSTASAALNRMQKKYINYVLESATTLVSPLTVEEGQILLMVVRPIFDLNSVISEQKPVGTLLSTFVVTENILHFLRDNPLAKSGEKTHILQDNLGVMQYVALNNNHPTLYSLKTNNIDTILVGNREEEAFDYSKSMIDDTPVFAVTSYVHGTPFVVLQEYEKGAALTDLSSYSMAIHGFMFVGVLAISIGALLLMNVLMNKRNKFRVNHQQQVINALVKAVEIRDPYLKGHHERVARMALDVANQMRLSITERSTLYYAAMLSGIGKIFVPRKILTKPTKLTAAEKKVLQSHIDHAMEVLKDMEFDLPIAEVIEQMYERLDGSGYPNKKKGTSINFLSRILGACDVYCALTKPRAYRDAMSVEEALKLMNKESEKYDKGVMGVLKTIKEV